MKNTKMKLIVISYLSIMFLVTCGKLPQEKLVGEWKNIVNNDIYIFNSDSTYNANGEEGEWEIKKYIILKTGERKRIIKFISDDEIEIPFKREPNLKKIIKGPKKGKSLQEKLVGEWEMGRDTIVFNSDGTVNADGDKWEWEIYESLFILFGEEGKDDLLQIKFISDDEIEVTQFSGKLDRWKRK